MAHRQRWEIHLKRKAEDLGAEVFLIGGPAPVDVAVVTRHPLTSLVNQTRSLRRSVRHTAVFPALHRPSRGYRV